MDILKKHNRFYIISILIGTILCVLWTALVRTIPASDFNYYDTIARQVATGGQWGNTYTSVGYSIALGFVYSIFGASLFIAKTFNVLLTLIGYFLFYRLVKKLKINELKKRIIFVIFVLFPVNIFYNSLLCTEILFTTLFLLITNIYFSENKYKYVIIGILTGIETMIKPFFMAFFFAIFLVEVIKKKKLVKPFLNALIVLVLSCVVIAPFVYRNTKMMGEFTFVSNNGGIVLYINNNSQNHSGRWMDAAKVENSIVLTEKYKKANMTEKNHMLSAAAKKWIKSHPREFFILGCKRLLNTYYVGDDVVFTFNGANLSETVQHYLLVYTNLIRNLVFLPATVLVVIYAVNVIRAIVKKKSDELDEFELYALISLCMFTGVYFITEGQGRYAFPFAFILIYFFSKIVKGNWALSE